ncbi:putative mitotic spindle biogenesis protein Spc19 [Pseudomassariella vexata]|uniref:DASH complex subunit SPC19 n=1 Tax=Pseudomassariella vexata TaxID=1141098 RepID=A0A1Y2D5X6_9PEZI|nr:putative mitotic spindle biogenesis protein Spc19 [Pseudomassariella vexata]ORY54709.1 putative mitotic spindle biogenesis protein Spc19 [Pseudomassariella vexata]
MSASCTASYADCVTALRGSLSHLETSVDTLGNGVSDFPRLLNVLKTIRHYELIPQPTLAAAESSLRDEIGPAITVLLDRADTQIDRVERRIESLKARSDLQQGRLSQASGDYEATHDAKGKGNKAAGQKLSGEARLRAKALRQRKEALKYSVERLELEVLQKERELKKQVDKA